MNKEKSQPSDTTKAGPGKDSYQAKGKGQLHQGGPKARQDGVNHKDSVNAGDHLWKHSNSEGVDPNA